MSLRQTVDSTKELISLAEAKASIRIDHDDDNNLIDGYRAAARKWAENYCQRSFFTQTWVLELDSFPDVETIDLLMGRVASVASIKYYDNDNSQQTWDSSNYRVDAGSLIGRIEAIDGWAETYDRTNAVEITYVAGETSLDNIPEYVKVAVKIMIGDLYELRQNVIVGSQVNVRNTTEMLLDSYRVYYAYK